MAGGWLTFNQMPIHARKQMLCLTDMWRAAGAHPDRRPAEWLRSADAERFIDALSVMVGMENSHTGLVHAQKGGPKQGTWAHWQLVGPIASRGRPQIWGGLEAGDRRSFAFIYRDALSSQAVSGNAGFAGIE